MTLPAMPTAHHVGLAIVAACRHVGEDPVACGEGRPKMRARYYAFAALRGLFLRVASNKIATLVGVINPKSAKMFATNVRRRASVAPWWNESVVAAVREAVSPGSAPPMPRVEPMKWTDQAVAEMRRLRSMGMSFSEVAAELGCSRNAAIGKAGRAQIDKDIDPMVLAMARANRARPPKPSKPVPYRAPIVAQPQVEAEAMDEPVVGVLFLDLAHDGCRYPLGEMLAKSTHFCGEPAATGRSYCGRHCSIAYQPPRQARANAEMSA